MSGAWYAAFGLLAFPGERRGPYSDEAATRYAQLALAHGPLAHGHQARSRARQRS